MCASVCVREREAYSSVICSWDPWGSGIATTDYLQAHASTRKVILQREIETLSLFLSFNLSILFLFSLSAVTHTHAHTHFHPSPQWLFSPSIPASVHWYTLPLSLVFCFFSSSLSSFYLNSSVFLKIIAAEIFFSHH